MSANLWDESTASYKPDSDGTYTSPAVGKTELGSYPSATPLAENQTIHMAASLMGNDVGYVRPFVKYEDAAHNVNYVGFPNWTPSATWQRFEGSVVVPSGMTVTKVGFNNTYATGEIKVSNPVFSYGSPVTLASSAHTPYATQDHVMVTYATKASLKVTDDSVKAEVSARAQTDRNIAELSSRLTQTANSLTSEISDRRSAITTVTGLANAAQSTADAAKSTAQTAASDAATAKTDASSAVSTANSAKSTAQTASTNASNAVSTANSANSKSDSAVSTANSAKSTAASASSTANAAKSTVDSMKLGGRNLLKGTSMDVVTGTYPSSADRDYLAYRTIDILDGDTYTLSFDAKSTHAGDVIDCYFFSPNTTLTGISSTGMKFDSGHPDGHLQVNLTDGWQRYWCTWTQRKTTTTKNVIPFRCVSGMGSGTVSMRGVKFEAGNKATDWTPAPEDTDSAVAAARKAGTDAQSSADAAKTMATENQSSIKQLSTSITAEVKARAKTDGAVSELSSKMEQTVNGINVSLDKLTATERQIHSWFDFGSDASGNPKLAMGSSSSPIIGEYSNTGTTYKDRSGATLLALDAANSTTGADHMVAMDVTVGKWKWVPTNGGSHFTLMWIGG